MTDPGVPLEQLLKGVAYTRIDGPPKKISSLTNDSRSVQAGALFFALRGEHTDGHRFIAQALERGAAAVGCESDAELADGTTAVVVPDSAIALSKISDTFFRSPSRDLAVAGVTGTNGKTTVTHMVAAIASAAGLSAGVIGTLGTAFDHVHEAQANTTPLAFELHSLLAQMRDCGVKIVSMEVSSHALALHRVNDVHFSVGALTNVTRDHLDFHGTPEAYAAAKRRLFDLATRAVLNADDPHGARWAQELRARRPVTTYALSGEADVHASNVCADATGSTFTLARREFRLLVPGKFNVANALCAIAIARTLDIPDDASARGLASIESVRGRMERIGGGNISVIVDYAHTPDALEAALNALRETVAGRCIVVFGCGGDRDRGKRAEMGAVVARHADFAYVTSDNPRTEDPRAIVEEILPGLGDAPHTVELDRARAIASAIRDARPGDVVVIAGKGHENYQIVGPEVLPFDDAAEARRALSERERVPT